MLFQKKWHSIFILTRGGIYCKNIIVKSRDYIEIGGHIQKMIESIGGDSTGYDAYIYQYMTKNGAIKDYRRVVQEIIEGVSDDA